MEADSHFFFFLARQPFKQETDQSKTRTVKLTIKQSVLPNLQLRVDPSRVLLSIEILDAFDIYVPFRPMRRTPRSLFWTSLRSVALQKEQWQTWGLLGTYFRLAYIQVGELHFCLLCNPCMALDRASSLSHKLAYVPGRTFGFVKLLASSGSHCTK